MAVTEKCIGHYNSQMIKMMPLKALLEVIPNWKIDKIGKKQFPTHKL